MSNNRRINLTAGWAFILLGIAGFILPVLQGFLFLIVGLLFLSKEYQWAQKLLGWLKKIVSKFIPKAANTFDKAERYLDRELQKIVNEKGCFRKRIWFILGILIVLLLSSYGLALLFHWLMNLLFR
jgi:uncharacterized membrane protein YbaN (DUF454 family)